MSLPKNATMVQSWCDDCAGHLISAARYRVRDTWRALLIVCQIAGFQLVMAEKGTRSRMGDNPDGPTQSLILAELGCMGCARPRYRAAIVKVLNRGRRELGKKGGMNLLADFTKQQRNLPEFAEWMTWPTLVPKRMCTCGREMTRVGLCVVCDAGEGREFCE